MAVRRFRRHYHNDNTRATVSTGTAEARTLITRYRVFGRVCPEERFKDGLERPRATLLF